MPEGNLPDADQLAEQARVMQAVCTLGIEWGRMRFLACNMEETLIGAVPDLAIQLAFPDNLPLGGNRTIQAAALGLPIPHRIPGKQDAGMSPFEVWFGKYQQMYPGTAYNEQVLNRWGKVQLSAGYPAVLTADVSPEVQETQLPAYQRIYQQLLKVSTLFSGHDPEYYRIKKLPQDLNFHALKQRDYASRVPRVDSGVSLNVSLLKRGEDLELAGRVVQALYSQSIFRDFYLKPQLAIRHVNTEVSGTLFPLPLATPGYISTMGPGAVDLILRSMDGYSTIPAVINLGAEVPRFAISRDQELRARIIQAFTIYNMMSSIVE